MELNHIAYISTDDLILTSSTTSDALELTSDIRNNKITHIRLMEIITYRDHSKSRSVHRSITRYVVDGEVKWGLVHYNLNGDNYYMQYSRISEKPLAMPMLLRDLELLYTQYNREDILGQLGL